MPIGNLQGRVRVSLRNPNAAGECDACGIWFNLDALQRQFEWRGTKLADTGFLKCRTCLDRPNQQNRTLILPPDPVPRINPRPSHDITPTPIIGQPLPTSPSTFGFTQYVVGGASIVPYYPTTKAEVLAAVATLSGIPTPSQIFDRSTTLTRANVAYPMMGTQPARGWILLYNPVGPQAQVGLANGSGPPLPVASMTATWGPLANLILGPGEAYFWATDQGLAACYQGATAAIGLFPGMPFWAWESGGSVLWLTDDFGTLITDDYGQAIPLS